MIEILSFIKTQYHIMPQAQVTFEGSPGTFDRTKLARIRKAGANRVSIGVQTFNEIMGRNLGLSHTPLQAVEALKNAAEVGFTNIGIDLMYNLPGQGQKEWLADVRMAIDMNIVHITLFSLCVVPFTNFAKQVERGDVPSLGNENYEIDLFLAARELLLKSGYVQYSVWDFAKPRYIDKHVTWYYKKQKDLFSHGPGAFGYINRCMYINRGNLQDYFKSLKNGFLPVEVEEKADEPEAMNGMMTNNDIERQLITALFNFFVAMTKESHLAHIIIASSDGYFLNTVYNDSKLKKCSVFYKVDYLKNEDVLEWLLNLEKYSKIKDYCLTKSDAEKIWDTVGGSMWEIQDILSQLFEHPIDEVLRGTLSYYHFHVRYLADAAPGPMVGLRCAGAVGRRRFQCGPVVYSIRGLWFVVVGGAGDWKPDCHKKITFKSRKYHLICLWVKWPS